MNNLLTFFYKNSIIFLTIGMVYWGELSSFLRGNCPLKNAGDEFQPILIHILRFTLGCVSSVFRRLCKESGV